MRTYTRSCSMKLSLMMMLLISVSTWALTPHSVPGRKHGEETVVIGTNGNCCKQKPGQVYNCASLESLGKDRCNAVNQMASCHWNVNNPECNPTPAPTPSPADQCKNQGGQYNPDTKNCCVPMGPAMSEQMCKDRGGNVTPMNGAVYCCKQMGNS